MNIEEKIDKICEMFKELIKLNAIKESEIDKTYFYLKISLEAIKEFKGSDKNVSVKELWRFKRVWL